MDAIHLILIIGALVCFFLAVLAVPAAVDLIALGLLLWAVSAAIGAGVGVVGALLILAAVAFFLAVLKAPRFNWLALGLVIWMVALLLGAVIK